MPETAIKLPTPEEIAARYEERSKHDLFGFETGEYFPYLPFEAMRKNAKEDAADDQLREAMKPLGRDSIVKEMEDYMEFAWEKANGCRGISAGRSLAHYVAWTWLAGDAEFSAKLEQEIDRNYRYYGKDILVMICEHYGWDSKKLDDGRRSNSEY